MVSQARKAGEDFWDKRFTSPAPWEHADVSTYDGLKFALAIERRAKEAARARADLPERQYYHPIRKTFLSDPQVNPQLRALGLDGQYYDYEKDDYYAWRSRGLRWSKTRRFPKSRWTKDWDHDRDKLLGHRPVGKQYDTEGLGSKESIRHWLKHSSTGYFRGRDRQEALDDSSRSVTAPELGPGSYSTQDLWRPKGMYCGVVKPSACFESRSRRDVVRSGFRLMRNGGGPSNPPKEVYVSSEEERVRVQRQLLQSRLNTGMGKPAPIDWRKANRSRGFSFPHQRRVTTAEQPALDAFARGKRYIRIALDEQSRMEAMAHGAHIPAAIIVPTNAPEQDLAACPTDEQDEQAHESGEVSQLHDSQDDSASSIHGGEGSAASHHQPSRAATAAPSVRTRSSASSSRGRKKRPMTTQPARRGTSDSDDALTALTTSEAPSSSAASYCSSTASYSRGGSRNIRRGVLVRGGPPPSSAGSRSFAAIDLFRQANSLIQPAQQPPVVLPRPVSAEPSLSASASVASLSAASVSAASVTSGFCQLAFQRAAQARQPRKEKGKAGQRS